VVETLRKLNKNLEDYVRKEELRRKLRNSMVGMLKERLDKI